MTGFIYVVASSNGLYKIGFTNDPRRRLSMLRTSTADTLTLLGTAPATIEQEAEVHHLLRDYRVAREWFRPCAAMKPLLDSLTPAEPARVRIARQRPASEPWRVRLEAAIDRDGRALRKISLAAGMGPNFVHEMLTTKKAPATDTLVKLTAALGIPTASLFEDAA